MLPWYLSDPARLDHERKAIEALASCEWLVNYDWTFGAGLEVLATARAHGADYQIRAVFPMLFPDAPIEVYPIGEEHRLSSHQYGGAGGPLCLEFGPDNWNPSVTCAMMISSAWKLLDIENPRGAAATDQTIAPSRHKLTLGQEIRYQLFRWYRSGALVDFIGKAGASGCFEFSLRDTGTSWTILIYKASTIPETPASFTDITLPERLPGDYVRYPGYWFATNHPAPRIAAITTLDAIKELLDENVSDVAGTMPEFVAGMKGVILRDALGEDHLFLVFDSGSVRSCVAVSSESCISTARAPRAESLAGKRIAIVGLGSVGSKAAVSLARMGAEAFLLVDHDIFLPENIARHTLDWQSVAQHKVEAVAEMLRRINPGVAVETSMVHIVGQESNAVVNSVFDKLVACDAMLDATGDARTLNVLSAIASRGGRPLVWVQVFAGGVGGFVARSRPDVDAPPHIVRATYHAFCQLHPAPEWMQISEDYTGQSASGEPIVADDAEVSIMAHHAARFVQDCFNAPPGMFPHQFYLIGLASEWVFTEPFAVIPVRVDSSAHIDPYHHAGGTAEGIAFLASLIDKKNDQATPAE